MALKIMADNGVEISAKQDGAMYNVALGNQDFIIKGIGDEFSMSHTGLVVTIESGECVIHGRHITADASNQITLPSNSSGYLALRIDLTQPIGQECLFVATPTLTHEEINWEGNIYDMPMATYQSTSIDISRFEDVRNVVGNAMNSHVGMIVHSTTLDTMEKVIEQYGGKEWNRLDDYFLVGASDTKAINSTGGSDTTTLSVNNLPSHGHGMAHTHGTDSKGSHEHNVRAKLLPYGIDGMSWGPNYTNQLLVKNVSSRTDFSTLDNSGLALSSGAHTHTTNSISKSTTDNVGSGTAFNNLPTYKAVYIWERTA